MKFWIRINGLQEGPMEIGEMKERKITPTTYVWCAGMKDWAYARDVEDLKDIITEEEPEVPSSCDKATDEATESAPVESVSEEDAEASKDSEASVDTEVLEEQDAEPKEDVAEADVEEPAPEEAAPVSEPEPVPVVPAPAEKTEPCPPTNLVWAILTTILCCMPLGIVAIVFAAQVNTKYYAYGYEEAKKYSDRAAWCVIWSIVLSILFTPIQMLFSLL